MKTDKLKEYDKLQCPMINKTYNETKKIRIQENSNNKNNPMEININNKYQSDYNFELENEKEKLQQINKTQNQNFSEIFNFNSSSQISVLDKIKNNKIQLQRGKNIRSSMKQNKNSSSLISNGVIKKV